jgi:hypothetical protein
VVNKSTVPVGSARVVERVLDRPDVKVVSNPEFLREGSAVQDFLKPDRIVVGSTDQAAAIKVSSLYLGVAAPVIVTDPASAETLKYAAKRSARVSAPTSTTSCSASATTSASARSSSAPAPAGAAVASPRIRGRC